MSKKLSGISVIAAFIATTVLAVGACGNTESRETAAAEREWEGEAESLRRDYLGSLASGFTTIIALELMDDSPNWEHVTLLISDFLTVNSKALKAATAAVKDGDHFVIQSAAWYDGGRQVKYGNAGVDIPENAFSRYKSYIRQFFIGDGDEKTEVKIILYYEE